MNCREMERLCQLYIDGRLPKGKATAFAEHLHSCTACSTYLDELQVLDRLLTEKMPEVEPPAGFSSRVMAALEHEPKARIKGRIISWKKLITAGAGLAAAVLLAIGAAALFSNDTTDSAPFGAISIAENNKENNSGENDSTQTGPNQETDDNQIKPGDEEDQNESDPSDKKDPDQDPDGDNTNQNTPSSNNGEIKLPSVAYGGITSGVYERITLAAFDSCSSLSPKYTSSGVICYTKYNDGYQKWLLDSYGATEPQYQGEVDYIPDPESPGKKDRTIFDDTVCYIANSPDGYSTAANANGATNGLYIFPKGNPADAKQYGSCGGGSMIGWSSDSAKLFFTDSAGRLMLLYPVENICVTVYEQKVSAVVWAGTKALIFSGYDAATGYYNIYRVSVP